MIRKRRMAALLTLLSIFLLVGLLPAETAEAGNVEVIDKDISKAVGNLEIKPGTKVNGDVTLNLGDLNVLGLVNGNVVNNIGQVNIEGDVNGDVEANMGQVKVSGNVSGDVKARMGEVIVDGSVGGNIYADLGKVKVDGSVGNNVYSGFGEVFINGFTGGDVESEGGNVVITGVVEGDVMMGQGVIDLKPDSVVSGRVHVDRGRINKDATARTGSVDIGEELTPSELQEEPAENEEKIDGVGGSLGQRIAGRVISSINDALRSVSFSFAMHDRINIGEWPFSPFMSIYGNIARGILNMLILFALATLTYTLFPAQVKITGQAISERTGPVIGWGLLAFVLAVPLMIALAITIIGIPLILVELIVLAAAAVLGYTGIASLVGSRVIDVASSGSSNPLGAIALGVVLIGLISLIPVIGSLVSLAIFILGVGAALATRFGARKYRSADQELTDLEE